MSATETPEAAAIAVRERSGAAIVKAVPIPAELQAAGVRIAEEEDTGLRVIVLPPQVRDSVNLLTPVSSWAQADPNWTPAISLVKLDQESHTYPLPGGKRGLNKQALETLGRTAGVLYTRTTRVPKDELQEGEMWAYRATVGFRRSDGTVDEVTRERGFNREAESMEIEDSVRGNAKFNTDAKIAAEIRKRWIAELRFGPAKTESKAINRALRAGLQMPASVATAALAKPFLVVGFNFTPDYSDPEIKRALVSVALNAEQAIYGGRDRSEEMPELEAGDLPAEAVEPEATPDETPADGVADQAAETGDASEQAAAEAGPPGGGSSSPEPALEEEEPSLEEEPSTVKIPEAAIENAGGIIAKGEKTIASIVEAAAGGDEKARGWLTWAMRNLSDDDERLGGIRLYAGERYPELAQELAGEAAS